MAREYLDRFCILDTETTGLIPRHHDIIEVAVLILDEYMDINRDINPFHTLMLPTRPENIDLNALKVQESNEDGKKLTRAKLDRALLYGLTALKSSNIFVDWFENIGLPPKGRLIPIAHNWPFDKEFMKDWLGDLSFDYVFSHHYMDTLPIAKFIEGVLISRGRSSPFGMSMRLKDISKDLGYIPDRSHNALDDCVTTSEVLKRLHNFIL